MDTIKSKILESLELHNGIVTNACKSIDLPRSTYYKWLNEDPEFKSAVDDIQEVAIDFVEGKLMEKINGVKATGKEDTVYDLPPSDTAIIFFLKTKAKKRGYVEKSEVEHSGNLNLLNEPVTFE